MTPSPAVPTPGPTRNRFPTHWTFRTPGPVRGVVLTREKGYCLAWDDSQWLSLIDPRGVRQGQLRTPWPLSAAACADDGTAYAVAGASGAVWWLAPDLTTRWRQTLPRPAVAVALDPFGQYLAVADAGAGLRLFTREGRLVWEVQTPRPLHHLAFVPETPMLVGSADFGLVVGVSMTGHVSWREGLVVHVGSLATSGDGGLVVLACFSEGLRCYTATGARQEPISLEEPVRIAALSYDGAKLLIGGRATRLMLLTLGGKLLGTHLLETPAVALAMSPLGERALAAQGDGRLVALDLRDAVAALEPQRDHPH